MAELTSTAAGDIGSYGLYVAGMESDDVVAVGGGASGYSLGFEGWLRDGRMVAGSETALLALDLSNGLLTTLWEGGRVGMVAPSPDGKLLAFTVDDHITVVSTDGSGEVGSLGAEDPGAVTWSHDSQWLAFVTNRDNRAPNLPSVSVVSRSDLGTATRLGGSFAFAWSANSAQLVLASTDGLTVVDLPSATHHNVYDFSDEFTALLLNHTAHIYDIGWSPSSKYVALAVGFVDSQGATASTLIVPLNGTGGMEFVGSEFYGWLPGVDRLVVQANWCSNDEQFTLVTPDGEVLSTSGHGNGLLGYLSPDGEQVAYVLHVGKSGQANDAIAVASTASGLTRIVASSSSVNMKVLGWSLDGKKLAFVGTGGYGWCEMARPQTLEIRPNRW